MSKTKVEINEAAFNQFVRDAVQSQPDLEYDIACPHCGKSIEVKLGDNTCDHCGGSIVLGLDPPSDQA